MHPSALSINTFLILSALPLLGLGLVLLKVGFFPRRPGSEPRCRACGYNVTGNNSGVCPECGIDLSPAQAVASGRRQRRRRWAAGFVGLLLALAGAACLTPRVRDAVLMFDWYALRPDGWVLRDLSAPAEPDQVRALGELRWRIREGKLSPERQRELIETLLTVQAASPRTAPEGFLTHLHARLADGTLTDDQCARFLRHLLVLDARVRPHVLSGASAPYQLVHRHRVPPNVLWFRRAEVVSVSVDGRELPGHPGHTYVGNTAEASTGSAAPPQPPGRHVLRAVVRFALASSREALERSGGDVLYEGELTAEAAFEVLPAGEADALRELDAPEYAAALKAAIAPAGLYHARLGPGTFNGRIDIGRLPVNVAFDVIVRAGGREYPAGTLARKAGAPPYNTPFTGAAPPERPPTGKADLVLRSSAAAARDTVDVTEFWRGELLYKDMALEP